MHTKGCESTRLRTYVNPMGTQRGEEERRGQERETICLCVCVNVKICVCKGIYICVRARNRNRDRIEFERKAERDELRVGTDRGWRLVYARDRVKTT